MLKTLGFEFHRWAKFVFPHLTLFKMECEESFRQSNIKQLKLIKN